MSILPELPDGIRIEDTVTGLSVRLPWRRPARRLVTQVVLKVVLLGLAILAGAVVLGLTMRGPHTPTFPVAVGTLGVALVACGLCLLATRSSAEVVGRELVLTEWIGPVPLRRSHFKARRRRLHALSLFTSRMRSCIPP